MADDIGARVAARYAEKVRLLREAGEKVEEAADICEKIEAASGLLTEAAELIEGMPSAWVFCSGIRSHAQMLRTLADTYSPMSKG